MKIIVNTSNLSVGGGMQVASSFIHELISCEENNTYYVFLSVELSKEICVDRFPSNFQFFNIKYSPASLKNRKFAISQLDELEENINPDIVFTVFGPSYWKPKAKHLLGIADGWIYNPKTVAYNKLPIIKRLRTKILARYKAFFIKRDAKYFVVETEDARNKICKVLKINKSYISVIGNTHSSIFNSNIDTTSSDYMKIPSINDSVFRLILISHNYPHKNIKIINEVLPYLTEYNIEFILTIDSGSYKELFSHTNGKVINLGRVNQCNCPSLYFQSDALFLPTLLETFSASYPEAMKMNIPILTSNYSFATDICGEAALYFDPLNPKDIAEKIEKLIIDKKLREVLIRKGSERLLTFETSQSRAFKYLSLCNSIVKDNK